MYLTKTLPVTHEGYNYPNVGCHLASFRCRTCIFKKLPMSVVCGGCDTWRNGRGFWVPVGEDEFFPSTAREAVEVWLKRQGVIVVKDEVEVLE